MRFFYYKKAIFWGAFGCKKPIFCASHAKIFGFTVFL
nr:MAG TPA: hypothetical protein [Caudoviricetes sp.]